MDFSELSRKNLSRLSEGTEAVLQAVEEARRDHPELAARKPTVAWALVGLESLLLAQARKTLLHDLALAGLAEAEGARSLRVFHGWTLDDHETFFRHFGGGKTGQAEATGYVEWAHAVGKQAAANLAAAGLDVPGLTPTSIGNAACVTKTPDGRAFNRVLSITCLGRSKTKHGYYHDQFSPRHRTPEIYAESIARLGVTREEFESDKSSYKGFFCFLSAKRELRLAVYERLAARGLPDWGEYKHIARQDTTEKKEAYYADIVRAELRKVQAGDDYRWEWCQIAFKGLLSPEKQAAVAAHDATGGSLQYEPGNHILRVAFMLVADEAFRARGLLDDEHIWLYRHEHLERLLRWLDVPSYEGLSERFPSLRILVDRKGLAEALFPEVVETTATQTA